MIFYNKNYICDIDLLIPELIWMKIKKNILSSSKFPYKEIYFSLIKDRNNQRRSMYKIKGNIPWT